VCYIVKYVTFTWNCSKMRLAVGFCSNLMKILIQTRPGLERGESDGKSGKVHVHSGGEEEGEGSEV